MDLERRRNMSGRGKTTGRGQTSREPSELEGEKERQGLVEEKAP